MKHIKAKMMIMCMCQNICMFWADYDPMRSLLKS